MSDFVRRSASMAAALALALPCVAAWAGQGAPSQGGAEVAGIRPGQPVAAAMRRLAAARPEWAKSIASFSKSAVESCGAASGSASPVFEGLLAMRRDAQAALIHLACDRPAGGAPLVSELWIDVDMAASDAQAPTPYQMRQALIRRHGDPSLADYRPDGADVDSPRGFYLLWTEPGSRRAGESYQADSTAAMSASLDVDRRGRGLWLTIHLWSEPVRKAGISPERRGPVGGSSGFDSTF